MPHPPNVVGHQKEEAVRGMWLCTSMLLTVLNFTSTAQQGRQMGGVGILVFTDPDYRGENATFRNDVANLTSSGLNDLVSSLRVAPGETWEVCEHANYRGRCQVFSGNEPDLRDRGWNDMISSMRRVYSTGGPPVVRPRPPVYPPSAGYGVELFDERSFNGDRRFITGPVEDLRALDFNDRAQSLRLQGSQAWEVCTDAHYLGCLVVNADWPDLSRLGKFRQISSLRPWPQDESGVAPPVAPPTGHGIELFDQLNYRGDRRAISDAVADMRDLGFDNRTQSLRLQGWQAWEVCTEPYFRGCLVVDSDWPDLTRLVGNRRISSVRPSGQSGGGGYPPGQGSTRLILYDETGFRGRSYTITERSPSIQDMYGMESARVTGSWQVCDGPQFTGQCAVITSNVPDLRAIGLRGRVQSARPHLTPY